MRSDQWPRGSKHCLLATGNPRGARFDPWLGQLSFSIATSREFSCLLFEQWERTIFNKRRTARVEVDRIGEFFVSCCNPATCVLLIFFLHHCGCPERIKTSKPSIPTSAILILTGLFINKRQRQANLYLKLNLKSGVPKRYVIAHQFDLSKNIGILLHSGVMVRGSEGCFGPSQ